MNICQNFSYNESSQSYIGSHLINSSIYFFFWWQILFTPTTNKIAAHIYKYMDANSHQLHVYVSSYLESKKKQKINVTKHGGKIGDWISTEPSNT